MRVIVDISAGRLRGGGSRWGKNGGFAILTSDYFWAIAHELGHAFGLEHDFHDGAFVMSYGLGARSTVGRLSPCHAEYLSVHPYFNSKTPIGEGERNGIIDIISPRTYPEGSQSVPIHLRISDSEGLHQVLLFVDTMGAHPAAGYREVKACRRFAGVRETDVEFDYDGVIPSDSLSNLSNPAYHPIHVDAVDTDGNVTRASFGLAELLPHRHIEIADSNLRDAIADAIGLSRSDPIQRAHLETLVALEAKNANISNLAGLESAINLKILDLGGEDVAEEEGAVNSNSISDLSPLRGLAIEQLNLEYNRNISDISAVSGMTELVRLRLTGNSISNISPVGGLRNLRLLTLNDNSISDISPVAALTHLRWLYLSNNAISNISALAGLTDLTWLQLNDNIVSNIAAVAGLAKLERLDFRNNAISEIAAVAGLTELERLGLSNNSISDIFAVAGLTNLDVLLLEMNSIADISAVAGLTNLRWLYLSNNAIANTHALAGLTNLTRLVLNDNNVTDIAPLAGLTSLELLVLERNAISDISPVAGLANLKWLYLNSNAISNIAALASLTNLKWLALNENSVSDISALAGLIALERLYLGSNAISNIAVLAGLSNLDLLALEMNVVSDISPLAENAGLGYGATVDLSVNPLNYQSIHTHVPTLQDREVTVSYDNRVPNSIVIVSGNEQRGSPSEKLANPFVVEVPDGSGAPFEGVPVAFTIIEGGGTLSAISVTTNRNGKAESLLTLGPNPGTNTVSVAVTGSEEKATFTAESIRVAKSLQIISGNDQQGRPGGALENPFVVEVRDQTDKPLPDVPVTFAVSNGGGMLSTTNATTNSNGRAESTLRLGPNLGRNTVTVSVTGVEEVETITAEGIRIAKTLNIIAGNDQQGLPGVALHKSFVVEVQDQYGEPLPRVRVMFSVTSGGGTLSATSAMTNISGRAWSILTLGAIPGTNSVTVSVTGVEEVKTFTAEGIRIPKTFEIISGNDQKGLPGAALGNPFVVEVRDKADEPLPDAQVTFWVNRGGGMLSAESVATDANGRAESILTLGPSPGENTVRVAAAGIQETQTVTAIAELQPIPEDVNRDDIVNILDLVLAAAALGDKGQELSTDINGDGFVNIFDLVLVATALGTAAAPATDPRALAMLTAAEVREWLALTGELDPTYAKSHRGVLYLERLLAALTPKETALLPNFPNPFNPETWIPYQLTKEADVRISIYDISGGLVRQLDLGHQKAGFYTERSGAAYWNGRNGHGERVASGVYFYTLFAEDFRATRKMLVGK